MKKEMKWLLSLVTLALVILALTALEGRRNEYNMLYTVLQKGMILAVAAVAMNLLNGFTGLFSLGQAGFMAIGAYVTAILTIPAVKLPGVYYISGVSQAILNFRGWTDSLPDWFQTAFPFLALIIGGLVAALFAALIGYPVLRLKSDYLAIATLGFSEIIRAIIASPQMNLITNGSYGLKSIPKLENLLVTFIIATVCIAFIVLLIRSSYGRAFKAIREDEVAAEAMGINLARHKQYSFVISSFFTAVAGGMLAMYMRSIDSGTFKISLTYDVLLIIVIGGIGSVTGSVISALLVTAAKEWWLRFFDQPLIIAGWEVPLFRTGFRMVIFSLLLMAVVLFYQRGLLGHREFTWDVLLPSNWRKWLSKKQAGGKRHA
jgi:branched-chain amino acid transport system permease protein